MDVQKASRKRRRSLSADVPNEKIRPKGYYLTLLAGHKAEEERYSSLSPEEKIAENGFQLQRELDKDTTQIFLLQPSPPRHMARARCRARYCLFPETTIQEEYRIVLITHERDYFHVSCLGEMIDLSSFVPERFKLDDGSYRWNDNWPWTWGLMLRKWFEHSGNIDIKSIARYIKTHKKYKREHAEWSTECDEWEDHHKESCDFNPCTCSFPLKPPAKPALEGYITEGQKCSLSRVLQHRYVEERAPAI